MKNLKSDILIVGAGLTGLMTAYSLSRLGINIVLIDKFDFLKQKNNKFDLRTTAISEGSKEFFNRIDIWSEISKESEPIKDIIVIDRNKNNTINFSNKNTKNNLGYIARNTFIKNTILKKIIKKKNIKLIKEDQINKISYKDSHIYAETNNFNLKAELLLAADGKNSFIRNYSKMKIYKKNYKHSALVINFHHRKNHRNIAHEIFLKNGPLAILPMKKIKNKLFSSSVIWSHKKEYIKSLQGIDKSLLIQILEEKIKDYVGVIEEIVDAQPFNLSAHINKKYYDQRIMYLGDAAHTIHPIAGQGWNLGVRDIKNCLETITQNLENGLDFGSDEACKKYHSFCYYDAFLLYQVTDKLNYIFLSENMSLKKVRKVGFKSINKIANLKNYITDFAMGTS